MAQQLIRIDLQGVNCYLAKGKNGFILFDTGGHMVTDKQFTNRRKLLQNQLANAGCTEQNLNLIILTHGDCDHTGNAEYLRNYYHAKIAMHSADRELVETPTLSKWIESYHYHSLTYRLVFQIMKKIIIKATQKTLDDFERFSPNISLVDGSSLTPYGFDATCIYIPGHTKGSIAILTTDGDLIAGDTFINTKKPTYSPNASDFNELSGSINKLKSLHIKTIYPGHGNPFEFKSL